jgi:cutinase
LPHLSRIAGGVAAILLGASATLLCSGVPGASAEPCPDIAVVFARGTGEPPGLGGIGTTFVDSLRSQAFPRTVGSHGVVYPASTEFSGGPAFTMNIADGILDGVNHIQGVTVACPNAQVVLAGFSQGAVVMAFITSGTVPAGIPPNFAGPPMPPEVADHVAAVVLFGKPSGRPMVKYGAPAAAVGAPYLAKSMEFCAPGDPVCSGISAVGPLSAHGSYAMNGMVGSGAAFAFTRLQQPLPPSPPV